MTANRDIIDSLLSTLIASDEAGSASRQLAESSKSSTLENPNIIQATVVTVSAWLVLVLTLEVNDFRHRLMSTYGAPEHEHSKKSSQSCTAALMAIQYGVYEAIFDWVLTYSVCYAVIGGLTWNNMDPNLSSIIWGISLMCSALLLAVAGWKIPEWLGFYHKSKLETVRETSGFSARAVEEYCAGGSVESFRYQVRLGVGRHFSRFVWFLLPFYAGLKVWYFVLSLFIGAVAGQLFLFVVFKCRQRYKKHRGRVALGAGVFAFIYSALAFMRGCWIIDQSWNLNIGSDIFVPIVSFFAWLGMCIIFQGMKYYEQQNFGAQEKNNQSCPGVVGVVRDSDSWDMENIAQDAEEEKARNVPESSALEAVAAEESNVESIEVSKSISSADRRDAMHKDAMQESFYTTVYFKRAQLRRTSSTISGVKESFGADAEDFDDSEDPCEVYKIVCESEKQNTEKKWYNNVWLRLPFVVYWSLAFNDLRGMTLCCRKGTDFDKMSVRGKAWRMIREAITLMVNASAIFLAIVACGAAVQATTTKEKIPFVHEKYSTLNTGEVCAFDTKCGDIKTFENKEASDAANYTVAHCGRCSGCSSWQDLSVQWNTRKNAAKLSQACGLRNMFNRDGMAECLAEDMGWTQECSYAWVHSIECAKQNCMYIAISSMITNQLANFEVNPLVITSANCNEAQCEQGNPGSFAKLSGASRRKMNIRSDIERPVDQQCTIVDAVKKDADGFNDWGDFFTPLCPRELSPP